MRGWWRCLLCLALVAAGTGASAQPAIRPATAPTTGLAATLTQSLHEQGLLLSDLTQPGADRRQGPGLFCRFMTAPEQAWADVDALARLYEARAYLSEVLRALRQQVGLAENNLAEAPAAPPPPPPQAHLGAVAVPLHIPLPQAGELQSALKALALADAWRQHAFVTPSPEFPAVQWRLETPLGTVLVNTTGAHNQHVVDHPLLLLDVGGNDHFQARASGAGPSSALPGYGVLWDTEGDDQHLGGWLVQGAALMGVALHVDDRSQPIASHWPGSGLCHQRNRPAAGQPWRRPLPRSPLAQGSAGPNGLALPLPLPLDPAGNDLYHLGNGVLVWPSSQLPDRNASMGQGAAFGLAGLSDTPHTDFALARENATL